MLGHFRNCVECKGQWKKTLQRWKAQQTVNRNVNSKRQLKETGIYSPVEILTQLVQSDAYQSLNFRFD